jgi:hypothetical protein
MATNESSGVAAPSACHVISGRTESAKSDCAAVLNNVAGEGEVEAADDAELGNARCESWWLVELAALVGVNCSVLCASSQRLAGSTPCSLGDPLIDFVIVVNKQRGKEFSARVDDHSADEDHSCVHSEPEKQIDKNEKKK